MTRRIISLLFAFVMLLSFACVQADETGSIQASTSESFAEFCSIPDTTSHQGGTVIQGYLKGADTSVTPLDLACSLVSGSSIVLGQRTSWKVSISGGMGDASCKAILFRQDVDASGNTYQRVDSLNLTGSTLSYTVTEEGRYFWEFRVMDENGEFIAFQSPVCETVDAADATITDDDADALQSEDRGAQSSDNQDLMGEDHVELFSEGNYPPLSMGRSSRGDMADFNSLILSELKGLSTLIDVSQYRLTVDEFHDAYRSLLNSHPEMFYVTGGYSYYYSGNLITRVIPRYKYSAEEIPDKVAMFNRELNKIINYTNKANTTVGKLLLASDYLCVNYEYDYPAYAISSPEEMFEKKRGVCNAYTLIYVAVCNRLGVTNTTASSEAMNHIWNMVNLNGSWYHVDVTWNDPIADTPYRALHNHFLRSDEGIMETGHYSWVASVRATNTKYDRYFWQDIDHAVSVRGNLAYFTPNNDGYPDGRICTGNIANGSVNEILRYDVTINSMYYPNINPVWAASDTVYFGMADTVYAMPLSGGTPVPVFSLNDRDEYLFYFYLSGSTMYVTSRSLSTYAPTVHSFRLGTSPTVTFDSDNCEMTIGDSRQLSYTIGSGSGASAAWISSDESVAVVNGNGKVTAVGAGVAIVTVQVGTASDECAVIVHSNQVVTLPHSVTEVEAEAFMNTAVVEVDLHSGIQAIGANAFANCSNLRLVDIPRSVTSIAPSAFAGSSMVTLLCVAGSEAEDFAIENNLPYVLK